MTEFIVVLVMLVVPLFIVLRIVGGMLAQQQKMDVAARYGAWERTVWHSAQPPGPGTPAVKTDERVASEIDRRIIASDDRALRSADTAAFNIDPFLFQVSGGRTALLLDHAEAGGSPGYARQISTESRPDGLSFQVTDAVIDALGSVTRFDLNQDGIYQADVSVAVIDLQDYFDLPIDFLSALTISRSNTIFGEAWAAGGRAQAAHLISGLVPQQFLDSGVVQGAQTAFSGIPVARELDEDWLRFGYVTIEPLPPHRLGPTAP